jgi:hypothetical protein
MKSMLIKAFLILVLIFQLGLDGQSQTSFGTDVDDVTSTTGPVGGSGAGGTGTGSTYTGGSTGRNDVPIDGGLKLLLVAAIGYGSKQLRKKNQH